MYSQIITPLVLITLLFSFAALNIAPKSDVAVDEHTLSGYVWDAETDSPLAGVEVKLKSKDKDKDKHRDDYRDTDAARQDTAAVPQDTWETDYDTDADAKTATTDEQGYFSFDQVEEGEHTVVIEHDGYEEYTETVSINDDEPVNLNVLLYRSE
jgi:hemin uptake protein HemP